MREEPNQSRRGAAIVAIIMVMLLMNLIIVGMVLGGARDNQLAAVRVQGHQAQAAADAAANLAVKELIAGTDLDGDGGIGTISNDSNTATDPTINSGTRIWATKVVAGNTTTITARAQNAEAARAVQVTLAGSATAGAVAGTVLFVVDDSTSLNAQETSKKSLIEGWGYTVVPITDSATQASYDAAVRTSSVAYISETANEGSVSTKLKDATIGVVSDEGDLCDEYGISTSSGSNNTTSISITNNTHYITSGFSIGTLQIATNNSKLWKVAGTSGGFTSLATLSGSSSLVVMERGASLAGGGTAAGRRVFLPWRGGSGSFSFSSDINANGRTILQRAIEWCLLPVSLWAMDSVSGSTAIDSVGANNGTLSFASWTTGCIDGAVQCSGVNSYVQVPNASSLQLSRALSVSAWMRCDVAWSWPTGSITSPIVRKGVAEPCNYAVQVADGRLAMYLDASDTAGIRGNTVLNVGQWNHLAATWDGSTVRLYVNGVLDNTPTNRAAPIAVDTRVLNIGGRAGGERFNGQLDDVRLYNRALTAGEIAAMAQRGTPTITGWAVVSP